jgi:hypothetical protein
VASNRGADEGLARSLRRLDTRIARWSAARWAGRGHGSTTRAEAAHELAITLAELARQAGNGAPAEPPPAIAAHAIADQLTVLGRELRNAPEAAAYAERGAAAIEGFLAGL